MVSGSTIGEKILKNSGIFAVFAVSPWFELSFFKVE